MRDQAAQAGGLLRALDSAARALSTQLKSKDLAALEELERQLDALLVEYRALIIEITAGGVRPHPTYEPFLRSMVAFSTIVELTAQRISSTTGIAWGQHVFSDADFDLITFDKLSVTLPEDAIRRILPDQASDLKSAFAEIGVWEMGLYHRYKARVDAALGEICDSFNCPDGMADSLNMTLRNAQWVADELKVDVSEVEDLVKERKIISVPTWAGDRAFPDYQIVDKKIIESVKLVCANADDSLDSWALAIWMANNVGRTEEFFERKLGALGLWKPLWNGTPSGEFESTSNVTSAKTVKGPLYRVSSNRRSPFYFSSADKTDPQKGGRFDLDRADGLGSLYTAESPVGAWSETLDRQLVVTLRELLSRRMWTLKPHKPVRLADLSGHSSELAATTKRYDTQWLANALWLKKWPGMLVGLRSRSDHTGVVIFGFAGPNLPSTAGIGLWSSAPGDGIEDGSLWSYVKSREDVRSDFPVVLRRFPSEMKFDAA